MNQFLKEHKIKSIMSMHPDNFPVIILFNGKKYEIRYTFKGNLYMTGYNADRESISREYIPVENNISVSENA